MKHRKELINDLRSRTEEIIKRVASFAPLSNKELNHRNTPSSWSILECLEHLNLYGDFYIPEIDTRLKMAQKSNNEEFISSWLGNYFAVSMLPGKGGKTNKMKTFKSMNPIHQSLSSNVLSRFMEQQNQILQLLNSAQNVDLAMVRTSISISKWIKLRMGDTLRVVVYHNQRHVMQAERILKELQSH